MEENCSASTICIDCKTQIKSGDGRYLFVSGPRCVKCHDTSPKRGDKKKNKVNIKTLD
ncbi:MAG: hypothetical protein ACYTFY_12080 [Planctomycetota bacterium]|jgi:hypothetical protein